VASEKITNLVQQFRIGCVHEAADALPNKAGPPEDNIGPGDARNYSIEPEPTGEIHDRQTY
jgi:hypothetical protein